MPAVSGPKRRGSCLAERSSGSRCAGRRAPYGLATPCRYTLSTTATAPAAVEALLDALHRHPGSDPAGLTIRSDHGSQYTSKAFNAAIKTPGLKHQYIWYKTPQQNGHLESFHGKLKFEYVWPADPESFQEAEEIILGAFIDYSKRRLHSSTGYMPPAEFAAKWRKANK